MVITVGFFQFLSCNKSVLQDVINDRLLVVLLLQNGKVPKSHRVAAANSPCFSKRVSCFGFLANILKITDFSIR